MGFSMGFKDFSIFFRFALIFCLTLQNYDVNVGLWKRLHRILRSLFLTHSDNCK
jgi:hypothetical protein